MLNERLGLGCIESMFGLFLLGLSVIGTISYGCCHSFAPFSVLWLISR
jgi:hypothetical protein